MSRTDLAGPTSPTAPPPGGSPASSSFRAMPAPRRLLVPLLGIGPADAAPRPAGTLVEAGEPLTQSVPQSAPAPLAPLGGVVCGIGRARLLDGAEVPAVVLDVAGPDEPPAPGRPSPHATPRPPGSTSESARPASVVARGTPAPSAWVAPPLPDLREALHTIHGSMLGQWVDRFRGAGLWADRWASPDLLAQLNACLRRPVDTLVCNALDLDPALPLQSTLAREHAGEIVAGVALLARLTGATTAWVVVETATAARVDAGTVARAAAAGVRLVPVDNEYPRANPTILLHALTRRKLPYGELPTTQGVLLLDAAAAMAVGRTFLGPGANPAAAAAVPIAVHHDGRAHLLTCPVGASLRDVLAFAGVPCEHVILRTGSPLRDVRVRADAVVGGSELTVFVAGDDDDGIPDPCIRCAWCVEGCPVRIQPAALLEASQRDDPVMAERYGLHACIECGICSYVCPSKLPLLQGIRVLRAREK